MSSWTSFVSEFRKSISRFLVFLAGREKAAVVESYLNSTNGEYIDVSHLSKIAGVSRSAAKAQLEQAVRSGGLEKVRLYIGPDCPCPIEVGEGDVGETITRGDAGFIENADEEIELKYIFVKEVYCVRAAV